jgi:phenylacetate-CoA ligase
MTAGRMKINTGGTSGQPLEFYIDSKAFAREWAHMHHIWASLGYRQTNLKLTFRGKNLGNKPIQYNPVHNECLVNAYVDMDSVLEVIAHVASNRVISFIHGYPSSIYNFAAFCKELRPDVIAVLQKSLQGILLSSEYPARVYRDLIEDVFRVPTISWYGHSEMAVLAYETSKFIYTPFHTYGFCEAVHDGNDSYRLVGTSYYNYASPFIRYDTGDSIEPVDGQEPLAAFRIESGRVGEFIIDAQGRRISLTALVFGRHHPLFGLANFIQIAQEKPGEATVLVTPAHRNDRIGEDWSKLFDSSNIDVRFQFYTLDKPFCSSSGKIPLLVPYQTAWRNHFSEM